MAPLTPPRVPSPHRPWMERSAHECAWPLGEGAQLRSCCAPVMRLASGRRGTYCRRHWRAMWRPALGPPLEVTEARVRPAPTPEAEDPRPLDLEVRR